MASVLDDDATRGQWKRIRAKILKRDHDTCQACGAPATSVDHITPRMMGGDDSWANLQALCTTCHRRKSKADHERVRAILTSLPASLVHTPPAIDPAPTPAKVRASKATATARPTPNTPGSPKAGTVLLDSPFRDTTTGA